MKSFRDLLFVIIQKSSYWSRFFGIFWKSIIRYKNMIIISLGKIFFLIFLLSRILTLRAIYKEMDKTEVLFTIVLVFFLILKVISCFTKWSFSLETQISYIFQRLDWFKDKFKCLLNRLSLWQFQNSR